MFLEFQKHDQFYNFIFLKTQLNSYYKKIEHDPEVHLIIEQVFFTLPNL